MWGEIAIRKLAAAALSFSGAVCLAHFLLPRSLWLYAAGLCLAAAIALGLCLRKNARTRALLISISLCVGFCVCFGSFQLRNAPAAAFEGYEGEIRAEITELPRAYPEYGYQTAELRLKTDGLPRLKTKLYSYDFDLTALKPGDIVSTVATLRPADMRAGERYDRYNADGIYLFATAKAEVSVTGQSPWRFRYLPKYLALGIENAARQVFSPQTAPLLTALLTGNTGLLYADEQLYANMSAAGILHVVSVSGMHVAFLVGFVQSILRKRRLSAVVSIALVWLFVPVAGATAAVIRAAFMQTTVLLAPLLRRENDAITSLSAILALLLLINPDACASVSLQLSFAAMLCMITITPRIYGRLTAKLPAAPKIAPLRALFGFGRGAGAAFASTVGALALSTPLAALHFGSVSLAGIIVNVLIFWLVSLCFILGYAACLLGLVWLPLGKALGALTSLGARLIIAACNAAASVPYATIYTGGTAFGWLLALVYVIVLLCFVFRRKSGFRPVLPVCLSLCALCAVIILTELRLQTQPARVTVLDVGQGQSIVCEDGPAAIVIDCGGKNGERNAGELCAARLLGEGRRSVDVLALTHFDDDHTNGATRLMSRVRVKNLILPAGAEDSAKKRKILEFARQQGTKVYIISEDTVCDVGDMRLHIYGPKDMNEPMLMYLWSVGDRDMLITGDAYGSEERYFLKTRALPPVEAYVAGHHGSKNSSSEELLSALGAKWAVISSGYNNYGHPAPETLKRLSSAGMEILRTDEKGNITLLME